MSVTGGRWEGVSLAVLCGGAEGVRPFAASSWLGALFGDVLWVGAGPELPFPGRRVADPPGPACPLRGLVGALEAAREERVLVLGCGGEPPAPDLVLALLAAPDADAVVPRTEAGSEPLRALYRREPVRSRARTRFEAGQLALQELLDELDVWHLEGPALASLCAAGCEQREGKGA